MLLCLQASQAFLWNKSQSPYNDRRGQALYELLSSLISDFPSCLFCSRYTSLLALLCPIQAFSYLRTFAHVWNALYLLPRYPNAWLTPSIPLYLLKDHLPLSPYSFSFKTLLSFFFCFIIFHSTYHNLT